MKVAFPKWYFHPVFVFVLSISALAVSLFLYIYWYMEASVGLRAMMEKFNLDRDQAIASETWVVILVLSILVAVILLCIFIIFVYNQKILQLYRLQNNFINSFTHELKTPVTSIKLFLQTFSRHELSRSDQLRYIEFMIADVGRLSQTINGILNLARIEDKGAVYEFMRVDVVESIERFVENNRHLFQNLAIEITPPDQALPRYSISPSLFEMLLMNLINNALTYNRSRHPALNIRFQRFKGRCHICFTDNGIGMDKREVRRVFNKFYQIGSAENMSAKGSGLGLYLAKLIVQIHKWKIAAVSEGEGRGSTFQLILPLKG